MAGPRARPARLLVVGSANLDIVVPVGRLPGPGETVLGGDRREFWGGKGANQAVAAARAGGRVRLVCLTGDDPPGAAYRRRLAREGLDRRGLLAGGAPTGTALIVVDGAGRNQIAVSPGANALLTPARLRGRGGLLDYGEAVLAQLEVPLATVAWAFRKARARGSLTLLNPAPAPAALPRGFLSQVDVLVPNETEAARLCGGRGEARRLCRRLMGLGVRAVVLTAGERGAFYMSREEEGWFRPPAGVKAVDTTGAGDAFCGALAVRLAEGAGLAGAARFAVAAASLSVRKRGAQEGLPGRREILRAAGRVPHGGG